MHDSKQPSKAAPTQWKTLAFLIFLIGVAVLVFNEEFRWFDGSDIRLRSGSATDPVVLSPNEAAAVTGRASIPEPGVFKIDLYNGSKFLITDITVSLQRVSDAQRRDYIARCRIPVYEFRDVKRGLGESTERILTGLAITNAPPLQNSTFYTTIGDFVDTNAASTNLERPDWSWSIVSVRGYLGK